MDEQPSLKSQSEEEKQGPLSAPLVSEEVDLRNFPFMPLDVRRLLSSNTWIEGGDDPRLGHALISLCAEAWHQVPAGSLPDNDKILRRFSMCPSAEEWHRIRERVLAGWVKCNDGRLYHAVVAEKARESWQRKLDQHERTRRASEKRLQGQSQKKRESNDLRDDVRDDPCNGARDDVHDDLRNDTRDVHQQKGTETEILKEITTEERIGRANGACTASPVEIAVTLRNLGVKNATSQNPDILRWADRQVPVEQLEKAARIAIRDRKKPSPSTRYLAPIVDDLINVATPRHLDHSGTAQVIASLECMKGG